MSGGKRKGTWPAAEAPGKRVHYEDADGDLDMEAQAMKQAKTRHGQVVTEGSDSEGSESDAVPRSWAPKADEDDMFADEGDASQAPATGKKEARFLKLAEIEGQEFGERTRVAGEETDEELVDPEEVDPEYELEQALRDTRYQDANADAERTPPGSDNEEGAGERTKKGMGFRIEQFNMKSDMASGQFDEEGNYIRNKKDPFAQNDRWLDGNYSKAQVKAAQEAKAKREAGAQAQAEDDEATYPTAEHALRALAPCLQPGESVLEALQRVGAAAKKERKGDKVEGASTEARNTLELITHLTTLLMSTFGQMNIYDDTYEGIVRQVRRAKLVSDDWDPSRAASPDRASPGASQWEYTWSPSYRANLPSAPNDAAPEVFGPFDAGQLRAWAAQAYFGPDQTHILLRPSAGGGEWRSWAAAGL